MIKALRNVVSTSVFVHEYRGFLSEMTVYSKGILIWFPAHRDIVVDDQVRTDTEVAISSILQGTDIPITYVIN